MNFSSRVPEIAIIGGGVIGLSCGFELSKRGAKVVVFERGICGNEASFAAGGMLAPRCESVVHPWGTSPCNQVQMLQFAIQSRDFYPQFAEDLGAMSGIDIELCLANHSSRDWREAGILYFPSPENARHFESRCAQFGGRGHVRRWNENNGIWLGDEGQVDNRKLVLALRAACENLGVEIRENSQVLDVEIENGRVLALGLGNQRIKIENLLVCAGAWSGLGLPQEIAPPVFPLAGQIIQLRAGNGIPHVIYSDDCYLVPRRDGRLLVGATVENVGFEKKVTARGVSQLLNAALRIEPQLANCELEDSWAGLRPASSDGLPILGRGALENLFFATGHGRNGILLAPQTSKTLAAAMLDGADVPAAFSPLRF